MSRATPSLKAPFRSFEAFPLKQVPADTAAWRVVSDEHVSNPVWFGCSGDGRFDLHPHDDHGVAYVGFSPAAAILKSSFRDAADDPPLTLTPAMFSQRRLCAVNLPSAITLANTRDQRAAGLAGITTEIATITPYKLPQWWSQALHHSGPENLDGIFYEPRHLPSGEAAAVYGARGVGNWPANTLQLLSASTLKRHLAGTGVRVLESPSSEGLTIV